MKIGHPKKGIPCNWKTLLHKSKYEWSHLIKEINLTKCGRISFELIHDENYLFYYLTADNIQLSSSGNWTSVVGLTQGYVTQGKIQRFSKGLNPGHIKTI